jgi:hypothetical protein
MDRGWYTDFLCIYFLIAIVSNIPLGELHFKLIKSRPDKKIILPSAIHKHIKAYPTIPPCHFQADTIWCGGTFNWMRCKRRRKKELIDGSGVDTSVLKCRSRI